MDSNNKKQLVELLKQLTPGFQDYDVFLEFARLNVLSIIEWVPLRTVKSKTQVLLLSRENPKDIWKDQLHTPGTVVRPTDNDFASAAQRIWKEELLGVSTSEPKFVTTELHTSKRGAENAQIFWVEVIGAPLIGEFYDVDSLPNSLIETQRDFISRSVIAYERTKNDK